MLEQAVKTVEEIRSPRNTPSALDIQNTQGVNAMSKKTDSQNHSADKGQRSVRKLFDHSSIMIDD